MMQRAFFSAFAAIFLSALLVQTAAAYPSTAWSGTSTVTGAYRPLNLDLELFDGTEALTYLDGGLLFDAVFSGTYIGDGDDYPTPVSRQAGKWGLSLGTIFDVVGDEEYVYASTEDNVITMYSTVEGLQVGELVYLGEGDYPDSLPDGDEPAVGDVFKLFSAFDGAVLQVVCHDGISPACDDFDLTLRQDYLEHLGPYADGESLAEDRVNIDCEEGDGYAPCGSVTLTASSVTAPSVPEPATLALLGLGLAGLGLSRRARA